MEQKPEIYSNTANTVRPSSVIMVDAREKLPWHAKLISAASMISGGVLGGKVALDQQVLYRDDLLVEGSWEKAQNSAAEASKTHAGASIKNADDTYSFTVAQEHKAAGGKAGVVLNEASHSAVVNKASHVLPLQEARALWGMYEGALDPEQVSYKRVGAKVNASLHIDGHVIAINNIKPSKILGVSLPGEGKTIHVTDKKHLNSLFDGRNSYVTEALKDRMWALEKDTHGSVFSALKHRFLRFDGAGKMNIAGSAVMGVVVGAVAAMGINALIRGGSHAADVVSRRDEQDIRR
jgi:hypothetical protein